jgi:hypothetical protein
MTGCLDLAGRAEQLEWITSLHCRAVNLRPTATNQQEITIFKGHGKNLCSSCFQGVLAHDPLISHAFLWTGSHDPRTPTRPSLEISEKFTRHIETKICIQNDRLW